MESSSSTASLLSCYEDSCLIRILLWRRGGMEFDLCWGMFLAFLLFLPSMRKKYLTSYVGGKKAHWISAHLRNIWEGGESWVCRKALSCSFPTLPSTVQCHLSLIHTLFLWRKEVMCATFIQPCTSNIELTWLSFMEGLQSGSILQDVASQKSSLPSLSLLTLWR